MWYSLRGGGRGGGCKLGLMVWGPSLFTQFCIYPVKRGGVHSLKGCVRFVGGDLDFIFSCLVEGGANLSMVWEPSLFTLFFKFWWS